MKRQTEVPSGKPIWRKTTQGTLYPFPKQRSRRVKFKEEIQATVEELGNKINQFELVSPGSGEYKVERVYPRPTPKPTPTPTPQREEAKQDEVQKDVPAKETYIIKHVGGGWYNVESSVGKVMNNQKLRSSDAEALKGSLEDETVGDNP